MLSSSSLPRKIQFLDATRSLCLPPDLIDGEEHYELEAVLDSRLRRGRLEYLVKWKGYGYEHNTWVPERDMAAKDLVSKFHWDHLKAPRRIQNAAFQSLAFKQLRHISSASGTTHLKGGVMSGDQPSHSLDPRQSLHRRLPPL